MTRRTLRGTAYKALRVSNDIRAVRRGTFGTRLARRAYGKITGRLSSRLFR